MKGFGTGDSTNYITHREYVIRAEVTPVPV